MPGHPPLPSTGTVRAVRLQVPSGERFVCFVGRSSMAECPLVCLFVGFFRLFACLVVGRLLLLLLLVP